MKSSINRCRFMRLSAIAAAAVPAALTAKGQPVPATSARRTAPDSEELTHYPIGPQIWLRWHNAPLMSTTLPNRPPLAQPRIA